MYVNFSLHYYAVKNLKNLIVKSVEDNGDTDR